ncbi:MAG: hypothetical protein M1828_000516 [Chrysothrix sp. TS-e1954]|nr:MAG: hypothetical protein M1828_000516 [Chrysothrix sp. TS-e1954]
MSRKLANSVIPAHQLSKRSLPEFDNFGDHASEKAQIEQAFKDMETMVSKCLDAPSHIFDLVLGRWFSTTDEARGQRVVRSLLEKMIKPSSNDGTGAMRLSEITIDWNDEEDVCERFEDLAWTTNPRAADRGNDAIHGTKMHLCDNADSHPYALPNLKDLDKGTLGETVSNAMQTLGGYLLVHELSHTELVSQTDIEPLGIEVGDGTSAKVQVAVDYAYRPQDVHTLAREDPLKALANADSYAWFVTSGTANEGAAETVQQPLLIRICHHISKLNEELLKVRRQLQSSANGVHTASDNSPKKWKLEQNSDIQDKSLKAARQLPKPTLTAPDISFAIPVRKKLILELYERDTATPGGLRAVNASSGECEAEMAWSDIDQVFRLPVPEKMAPAFNFVIIPKTTAPTTHVFTTKVEPIVFSLPANASAPSNLPNPSQNDSSTSYVDVLQSHLDRYLKSHQKRVTEPSEAKFASSIPQPHRKGEKAHHVKAFRGSKEGYLYFLPSGILFGFKKPLLWFPFTAIESVSYTSILARTFNLNIVATGMGDDRTKTEADEIEFSMVDQADHGNIDKYVRAHGLNDASLAEQRKAKAYNINGPPPDILAEGHDGVPGAAVVDADSDDENPRDAAARAEMELQDREDEEEEDFDPESGNSDRSASGSETEGDEGDGGEETDGEEVDSVLGDDDDDGEELAQ